jgi:hypothetical protein
MAQRGRNTFDYDDDDTSGATVMRFAGWAGLAAIAIASATLAARTQTGTERLAGLARHQLASAVPVQPRTPALPSVARPAATAGPAEADVEARRVAESIRALAADRDRLLARLEALERTLDQTGSVARESAAVVAQAAASPDGPLPPTWSFGPGNMPAGAGVPPPLALGASSAASGSFSTATLPAAKQDGRSTSGLIADEQAAESVATKTEFAIDIGGDSTFEGLRALWSSLKAKHGALFNGLRPVVAVREGGKPGALELRLVIGPLNNAGTAARLCATLTATGLPCQPTVFDGQRFALR